MSLLKNLVQVLFISIFSRLFYITVAYASSVFFEPYDKSTKLVDNTFFSFLLRWDAINFYIIASRLYVTEHIMAFFPFYPLLVAMASKHLNLGVLASGILISNSLFCFSAIILYLLTIKKYSKKIGFITTILFCFNPSSIVYCTLYSESLFTFLFLLAFLFLEHGQLKSVIFFSLCNLTRSNGILFIIFTIFNYRIFYLPFLLLVQLMPFVIFQLYSFIMLRRMKIYIPYSYIQSKYWDQGFLRFYKDKKNIPNCLISLPFILLSIYLLISYAANYRKKDINLIILMLIFYIQTFMTIFFIHSQIFLRFVSFNPVMYWSLSHMLLQKRSSKIYYIIAIYFMYSIAYAILFGAYYPPA